MRLNVGMRAHRKLLVWKIAVLLVEDIHKIALGFPDYERFELSSQMRKAAVSVPSNIAEGAARKSDPGKLHFFNIAQGSLSELDTQVEIAHRLNYIDNTMYSEILRKIEAVSLKLYGLSRKIEHDLNV